MTDPTTLPPVPDHPEPRHMRWSELERKAIADHGHACAEAARAPLVEENARLLARVAELDASESKLIAKRDHAEEIIDKLCDAVLGSDREEWSSAYFFSHAVEDVEDAIAGLRADLAAKAGEVEALRAASVIEWEPGRSYTAAELLRRAIWRIRLRRGKSLWPAIMDLCSVGSNVAHHLCRWAGRDPDTGKEIAARKGEGSEAAAQAKEGAE